MRERWNSLERLAQVLLIIQGVMLIVFFIVYLILSRQQGIVYHNSFLVRQIQGADTCYTGTVDGLSAAFRVAPEGTVTYQLGDWTYGPYTVSVRSEDALTDGPLDVEIREGDTLLFRGSYAPNSSFLRDESGAPLIEWEVTFGGTARSGEGANPPTLTTLFSLVHDPELTHRGSWLYWVPGTFLLLMGALSILFADSLFRWRLFWRFRNPEGAEPSEWELFTRRAGWVMLSALALLIYLLGLRAPV